MASKAYFDKTLFTEKRNSATGEREIFLTIENSVEERVETLEQMLEYKRLLKKVDLEK